MVLVQSSKLSLPPSVSATKSLLFEPNSLSLALMHTDSSVSLFPSLPIPSLPSLPPKPQTLVPSPSSSSSFLLIHQDPVPKVLFLVASPYKGGSQILLRFHVLQNDTFFYKPQVVCNQKGLAFDSKLGVLLDINHGVSIKIVGSINFFVLHSVSSKKVWVFAVKLIDDVDGEMLKLMRCAVIECSVPVWSISVSSGVLILGEDNGVRVFNLRQLVKWKVKKVKGFDSNGKLDGKGLKSSNGAGENNGVRSSSENACNGALDGKTDKHCVSAFPLDVELEEAEGESRRKRRMVLRNRKGINEFLFDQEMDELILSEVLSYGKQRSVRCSQDSGEGGACFVAFKREVTEGMKPTTLKAVSIQALPPKKFVILDSTGDLHILCLSAPVVGPNVMAHMRRLPHSMKVQKLAVFPDFSSKKQTFWVSDGLHSVHTITLSNMDAAVNTNDGDVTQEKSIRITVIQAILSAEKIQDLVPLGANGILILGQGNFCLSSEIYIHTQFPEVAWHLELIYLLVLFLVYIGAQELKDIELVKTKKIAEISQLFSVEEDIDLGFQRCAILHP
ncbi:hypothetical protein NC651_010897 [Populus alba x Populus x berolinensis]|nr:hypothetical protein NC651_010897 [Populus alba x Populus x berolinensis]